MFYSPWERTRDPNVACVRNSFIFTTKQNIVAVQLFQGELKCIRLKTLFGFSARGSEMVSNLAGGVRHSPSITLIINLNAVEGADNKELKRNRLAESEKRKRRSRRGSAWIIHLPHNQRCLPYLWAKKKKKTKKEAHTAPLELFFVCWGMQ